MGKGRGRADMGFKDITLGFLVDFIHLIKYLMKFQNEEAMSTNDSNFSPKIKLGHSYNTL